MNSHRCSSSNHSNIGKSTTQRNSNFVGSSRFSFFAICSRSEPSRRDVGSGLPAAIKQQVGWPRSGDFERLPDRFFPGRLDGGALDGSLG